MWQRVYAVSEKGNRNFKKKCKFATNKDYDKTKPIKLWQETSYTTKCARH